MDFTSALADVRDALIAGEGPDCVVGIAIEYGIPVHALRNRAERAYGDLATYAERTASLRTVPPESARKLALGEVKQKLERLGEVRKGSPQADQLHALVEQANELSGGRVKFGIGRRRVRR